MKRYIYHLLILTLLFSNVFQALGQQQNFLTASENTLYDIEGKEVRLTGVNWFGFETSLYQPHGIWTRDMKSVLQQIKDIGFNTIRVPWCNEMLNPEATVDIKSYGTDAYSGVSPMNEEEATVGTAIELMDIFVRWCQKNDMKIVLDNHSRAADGFLNEEVWYTDAYSEERWINDWLFIADRYKEYSAVVAMDLNNEPHGSTWGNSNPETDWNKAAERCGNAILAVNPNVLIIVEGVGEFEGDSYWWGGQLKGAAKYPVQLSDPSKLFYSAHEYGPEVAQQDWFEDANFPNNMPAEWGEHFHYLYENNTSPLFIGEFGIKDQNAFGGIAYTWFTEFMDFMGSRYSWTFWTMNPNSGDTGGILQDDWASVNQWKVDVLSPYFAPLIPNVIGGTGGGNTAPIARATASITNGNAPLTVEFNGSTSSDVDNDDLTYSWDFDDGTSARGDTVAHTFITEGIYQVVLTVNDGTINDTANITITVSDEPAVIITASISSNITSGVAPVMIDFNASNSTSSDGSVLTYNWNFGDTINGNGNIVSHTYTNAGSYIVTLTATNTDGISDIATQAITITEDSGPSGDCSFGVPLSTPLPTILNASYANAYVLGNGGPDLSNIIDFKINWDLPNNGLWQFSINTNNGVPDWWNDLKSNITSQNFNSSQPEITLSETGFSGFDGSYYAAVDGSNFVLVSVDGEFTIYFSNSSAEPTCDDANKGFENAKDANIWRLQSNPSNKAFYIDILAPEKVQEIRLYSITGRELQKLEVNASEKSTISFGENLASGMYLLKLMKPEGGFNTLRIIKK